MNHINWNADRYSVGDPQLDKHHKEIVRLIEQLMQSLETAPSSGLIRKTLDKLKWYGEWHLQYEAELLSHIDFDGLDDHLDMHNIYFQRLSALEEMYQANDPDLGGEIMSFLLYWLNQHILKQDMAFKPALVAHNERQTT